jgi:hypothetical protein
MAWRGLALVLVSIAGLVAAYKAPGPLLQGFVIVSFGMLGAFAALIVARSHRSSPLNRLSPFVTDTLREIRRLASRTRPTPAPYPAPGGVDVVQWPDEEDGGVPEVIERTAAHTTARQLADRLAPRVVEVVDELGPLSPQEVVTELLREAEDLRSLGRLLRLDLTAYGNRISRGLAAARAGRLEDCALALQVANERLRAEVQAAVEKELSQARTDSAFRR